MEIRFPVSNDNSHVNVAFKWHDAFVDRESCSQKNIHFEKAAVLFCMGALECQRGADEARDIQASIAEAAKAFSQAAGAMHAASDVCLLPDVSTMQPDTFLRNAHSIGS